jgi:hypothetical protein
MALRALTFDDATRAYLVDHPSATVVALAEGLQTSFYRIEASDVSDRFRWLTVDLPPIVELRTKLLPVSDRQSVCAQSALDYGWMDQVDDSDGVFITAEGRCDVDINDVLDLAAAIAWVGEQPSRGPEQRQRLLNVVIDGLRSGPRD